MFKPIEFQGETFTPTSKVGDRTTYQTKDGKVFDSYSRSPMGVAYDAYAQGVTKTDPYPGYPTTTMRGRHG